MFKIYNISLEGKVAIVTGGVQGIGRAITFKLVEAGLKAISILDLKINEDAQNLAKEIKKSGTEVLLIEGDVSKTEDMKNVIDETAKKWNRLDIMVNNAGIGSQTDFFTLTEERWDLTVDVNLRSMFLGIKYASEYMKKHGGGCIVNMSSISGITGGNTGPDYGATKAGVIALTKFGAKSLSKYGIRINALAPGTIETPMVKSVYATLDAESLKKRLSTIPMGRMGNPEEVAKVVLFLVSDLASYVNGETIMVTGGRMS